MVYAQVGLMKLTELQWMVTQFLTAWALTKIDGDYLVREKQVVNMACVLKNVKL